MFRIQVVAYQWRHFQRTFQGRERLSSGDLHILVNVSGGFYGFGIIFPSFQRVQRGTHENSPELFGMMSPTLSFGWSLMLDMTLSCSVQLTGVLFYSNKNSRTQLISCAGWWFGTFFIGNVFSRGVQSTNQLWLFNLAIEHHDLYITYDVLPIYVKGLIC